MRLIKFSLITTALGFTCFFLSYLAANQLDQAKAYSFPQSIGRHYAQVSSNVFNGVKIENGKPVEFKKNVPADTKAPLDTLEIETVSINVEIAPSTNDEIQIELNSTRVNPEEPVIVDVSRGSTVRILTQENEHSSGPRGWLVFNFDDGDSNDDAKIRRNTLLVRVPKSILHTHIRTVSGDGRLEAVLSDLRFQSKSGGFKIATDSNPLARVESMVIETISGGLTGPGRFDKLRFDSVSGDMKLSSLDRVLDINGQTISGAFRIRTSEPLDAQLEFSTKSGEIKIDDALSGHVRVRKNSNLTFGKGTKNLKFRSISGDLRIRPVAKNQSEGDDDGNDDSSSSEDKNSSEDEASLGRGPKNVVAADPSFTCALNAAIKSGTRMGSLAAPRQCRRVVAAI